MANKLAIQMDHPSGLNYPSDSTVMLGLEAQKRGLKLFFYEPKDLVVLNGVVHAVGYDIEFNSNPQDFYKLTSNKRMQNLHEMDVVLMRQDPPFDMNYITATFFLELLKPKVKIFNDPVAVRNASEKLLVLNFPELIPPTIITRNLESIQEFGQTHKEVVIKPLHAFGGRDIFHIKEHDDNFHSVYDFFTREYQEPLVVQKFLPEVRQGDTRLFVLDGNLIAGMTRIPPEGEIRTNLASGGSAYAKELTPYEQEVGNKLAKFLKERDILFAGIDMIGQYVTEINVTCPTGMRAIDRLYGIDMAAMCMDALL